MTMLPSDEKYYRYFKSGTMELALKLFFALILTVLMGQVRMDYFESYSYDLRMRTNPTRSPISKITLVTVNPQTVQLYQGLPDAKAQDALLATLLNAGAKAVVYDVLMTDISGSDSDIKKWEQSIRNSSSVFVAGREAPLKGEEKKLRLAKPYENINLYPAPKTSDLANFAKDGVTRRMMLQYQDRPMMPLMLAELALGKNISPDQVRGHFQFYGSDQAFIDFLPSKSYPTMSFEDALSNSAASEFKDKIVIIGTDLNLNESEYVKTPYGREVVAMTRAELLANSIDTIIRNSGPVKPPSFIDWILIFVSSFLAIHVVLTMKPTKGLLVLGGVIIGYITFSASTFWLFKLWLPITTPLLSIFLCYYFFIPYRLIVENRRSWEYYQKNKILHQVEELKTNFISMMSHDLKTPIARIQGMTDVILSDSIQLSHQQRDAVDTIKQSSDDLLRFINSILNYGKIESKGVQLHLQSKDINSVLEEVIGKHEFLAKLKRIQILTALEPMFPVPMDADLMKQVFSNLVENAIKYSPEDTKILISSEEKDSKILIQVADQGPGIPSDELPNVFMKFFRSKNAKSSPVKGSGLGLYLAKYFIELHKGQIYVESVQGQGSTFFVEMPMEQGGAHAQSISC